ncbi:neutral zinc metallopeptidase [Glacieibacterium sp.]|uniref:KPN_02809 family neutral zinc metallopeptidase n=1 Tax=Glacieibacterium sp. TaxID=2860237 RepID=UPI003AFFB526
MRFDDQRESDNIDDQRGSGGGMGFGGGGFGGGGGLLPMLLGLVLGRKLGCGTIVLLGVAFLVFGGLGGLGGLLGGGGGGSVGPQVQIGQPAGQYETPAAGTTRGQESSTDSFVRKVLGSTEDVWAKVFPEQVGKAYQNPRLVLFSGSTQSGCGGAESAMGPFYCPADRKVYLDESFFDELQTRFGAKGDAAAAYVIAHEIGHHIQQLIGVADQVRSAQERASERQRNALSVKLELQADCFAGVWAKQSGRLEAGDVEEAVTAAQAIGDDTLQRQSRGQVVPDSFTHGSSAQRVQWLQTGLNSGQMESCNTFAGS